MVRKKQNKKPTPKTKRQEEAKTETGLPEQKPSLQSDDVQLLSNEPPISVLRSKIDDVRGDGLFDNDYFGDGDQTQLFGVEAMTLQAQTSRGMDYSFNRESNLSGWSNACFLGDLDKVKQFLSATTSHIDRRELIERRESMMRFSGIFHVVLGARKTASQSHILIAKHLIDNGARVNAKDNAGMTPLHYSLSQFGNTCTFEIAKLLLESGADVNATNRFGATPLFEPCITAKYDFVELLVLNGCNPKHRDSHGVSCYAYAMMNPKIKEIFAKGNKKLAEKNKLAVEEADESTNCASCEAEALTLKKCSGCLTVSYCSLECQKSHWKTHKSICKAKQIENKQNDFILVFHPIVHLPNQSEDILLNEKSEHLENNTERAMIIKVQVCSSH